MSPFDFLLQNQPLYPFRLEPIYKDYLWGGDRLRTLLGRSLPKDAIAESWEIANHPHGESVILNGPLRGRNLAEVVENRFQDLVGEDVFRRCSDNHRFPLMLKYLDARLPLSVQVHPNDEQAKEMGFPDFGKTEAWVVVDVLPGSSLWLGTNRHYSKQELENAAFSGALADCLHRVEPKVGDCFYLPPGTLHALGAGIMVAEVQTNSDLTFRLFDWNRLDANGKPRELRIAEALRSLPETNGPVEPQHVLPAEHEFCERLLVSERFTINRWTLTEPFDWKNDGRAHMWTVLDGSVHAFFTAGRRIAPRAESGRSQDPEVVETLRRGDSLLVPAMSTSVRWNVDAEQDAVLLDAVVM